MVYEYPKEVNKHWMSNLCNIANTVTLPIWRIVDVVRHHFPWSQVIYQEEPFPRKMQLRGVETDIMYRM